MTKAHAVHLVLTVVTELMVQLELPATQAIQVDEINQNYLEDDFFACNFFLMFCEFFLRRTTWYAR